VIRTSSMAIIFCPAVIPVNGDKNHHARTDRAHRTMTVDAPRAPTRGSMAAAMPRAVLDVAHSAPLCFQEPAPYLAAWPENGLEQISSGMAIGSWSMAAYPAFRLCRMKTIQR
jgi:hypothetical protein